jgi:UDP-N-acetylglucosamine 2-epimerase (hydrolysing)
MTKRSILFVTGTRADFGKLKPLMLAIEASDDFECRIFVTGMHMIEKYGHTVDEVRHCGFSNVHTHVNSVGGEPMEIVLANTISGLSLYLGQIAADMIVVHGDRCEALAGAITGALRNVRVAHVEGGELSGTVDELIRHAVTKMSHLHFVANDNAARRLRQLGETPESIFEIGSPDVDIMISQSLPSLEQVRSRYNINFDAYGILTFHPVVTELAAIPMQAKNVIDAVKRIDKDFVVIYPNNDLGSDLILSAFERLKGNRRFRIFPSIRFEYFITLLKNADFIVGNSSAGIREAPYFGTPTVNVGTRQHNRFNHSSIINTSYRTEEILAGMEMAMKRGRREPIYAFGDGRSLERFMSVLSNEDTWKIDPQKRFQDIL